jgi:hypothetical protein
VFDCILSLSTISFWDDSKVCGEKKHNKTTGAYPRLRDDRMGTGILKANRNTRAAKTGCEPYAAVRGRERAGGQGESDMCENP